jgi:hypothetical protein
VAPPNHEGLPLLLDEYRGKVGKALLSFVHTLVVAMSVSVKYSVSLLLKMLQYENFLSGRFLGGWRTFLLALDSKIFSAEYASVERKYSWILETLVRCLNCSSYYVNLSNSFARRHAELAFCLSCSSTLKM